MAGISAASILRCIICFGPWFCLLVRECSHFSNFLTSYYIHRPKSQTNKSISCPIPFHFCATDIAQYLRLRQPLKTFTIIIAQIFPFHFIFVLAAELISKDTFANLILTLLLASTPPPFPKQIRVCARLCSNYIVQRVVQLGLAYIGESKSVSERRTYPNKGNINQSLTALTSPQSSRDWPTPDSSFEPAVKN